MVWTVLAVASVLALQVLLRKGPPSSSIFKPPKLELPALDPPKREPAEAENPAAHLHRLPAEQR